MDSNERKIVQELVTALGCVIPASDGYEPRTNLWNKYMAAKNLLAAAPQVVADERYSSCLATIRDLDRISMKFAADLAGLPVVEGSRMRNVDYLVRYSVLELVATWRSEWDENSLQRMPIGRAALQAAPVQAQELSDATIINAANKYGISPHAAMPFVRELIASQSTTQEIRAVANPVEFDGIKTDAVQAQEPEHVPVRPGHFPQRDPSKPAEQQGVFKKFDVWRTDGSSAPGGKHRECRYFVLDVDHDALAKPALQAYAAACAVTHPDLSADMVKRFDLAPAQPVAVPDGPSAEDYSDMLRAFFFHYAAGGYNDEGGLVPLETVKDKLEWIVNEAIQHAAPAAQGDAKGEYFLIEKDGRHYNFFADTETVDLLTRNGYKVIPAAAIAAKAAA